MNEEILNVNKKKAKGFKITGDSRFEKPFMLGSKIGKVWYIQTGNPGEGNT